MFVIFWNSFGVFQLFCMHSGILAPVFKTLLDFHVFPNGFGSFHSILYLFNAVCGFRLCLQHFHTFERFGIHLKHMFMIFSSVAYVLICLFFDLQLIGNTRAS